MHVHGVPVLVTPWGDGGSLSTFLESEANGVDGASGGGGGLPPNVALELAIQLCRGLRHLHDQGVVHYDLKPANVIIFTLESKHNTSSSEGGGQKRYVLKVADFGLSRGLKDWLSDGTTRGEDAGSESGDDIAEHKGGLEPLLMKPLINKTETSAEPLRNL